MSASGYCKCHERMNCILDCLVPWWQAKCHEWTASFRAFVPQSLLYSDGGTESLIALSSPNPWFLSLLWPNQSIYARLYLNKQIQLFRCLYGACFIFARSHSECLFLERCFGVLGWSPFSSPFPAQCLDGSPVLGNVFWLPLTHENQGLCKCWSFPLLLVSTLVLQDGRVATALDYDSAKFDFTLSHLVSAFSFIKERK